MTLTMYLCLLLVKVHQTFNLDVLLRERILSLLNAIGQIKAK
jgi:hypothetical protein